VLDQLVFGGQVDRAGAEPYLSIAGSDPDPYVQELAGAVRDYLGR
jgi:hypothetical protein